MRLPRWLLYLTNNLPQSKHEKEWDVFFFLVETIAMLGGVGMLIGFGEPQWAPVVVIEWAWAVDQLRHNR